MRLALCNEVLGSTPFDAQCVLAAQLGYDGLEVAPFTLGDAPHLLGASQRRRLIHSSTAAGLPITSLHWILVRPAGLSITSLNERVYSKTIDVIRRLIGLAHDLGCTAIVHGSPEQRRLPYGRSSERARGLALEAFAVAGQEASAAGLTYCIEPLAPDETNFVNSVGEAAEIVRAIGNPALRTMIDCNAAFRSESETVPMLIDRWVTTGEVAHIHLNDRSGLGPGQGSDRFAGILAALKRQAFEGVAAVEPFQYYPSGSTAAARAIGYIRGIEEGLEAGLPQARL